MGYNVNKETYEDCLESFLSGHEDNRTFIRQLGNVLKILQMKSIICQNIVDFKQKIAVLLDKSTTLRKVLWL